MKIAILGAGMVGTAMALDLAKQYEVTSFDISDSNLQTLKKRNNDINIIQANLKAFESFNEWLAPFDIVVNAVPGFMGFESLKAIINAGKNAADIAFFPEDSLQLDAIAKAKNVTVITDMGVAPGISNLILGRYNEEMIVNNFEFYVGGLPKVRRKPFEYKAPFSPSDVIEIYTRPSRLKEHGHIVVKPALTEREYMDFDEVGTLEAFNSDGLRSLLFTLPHIPNMKEKTLRYPGHIEMIVSLMQTGFFDEKEIEIHGVKISPLEFSSKILFNNWKLGPLEEELTVMKVIVEGEKDGNAQRVEYDMVDRYSAATQTSSMGRTTGYTCTAAVNLIAKHMFVEKGIFPPELVGKHKICFEYVMQYLAERGVIWRKK